MKRGFVFIICSLTMFLALAACGHDRTAKEGIENRMEQLYRLGFENYLQQLFDIEKYDNLLSESELNFLPAEGDNITQQQENSMLGMKYIYVRNDIHLERLTEEDYEILKDAAEQTGEDITGDTEIPDSVQEMIERTFCNIIAPNIIEKEEDKTVLTSFDVSGSKLFTNNSIVFYVVTQEEFDKNGEYVDEENEHQKKELLEILCSQMESEFQGKLEDTPVRVFSEICY